MAEIVPRQKVTFIVFFLIWAKRRGWTVPDLHVRICHWLETCGDLERVLLVFRGAAKSTIYAVYKAWQLYCDPTRINLVWAADDKTAKKLTRDTINVLRRHPLTRGMLPPKPGAASFWVTGSTDARNASMEAVGVSSNATGSRADAVDYDDIEVPKNVANAEARENLRNKIGEATHIAVPGAQHTFIGTPHTHETIYNDAIDGGAALLKIPLFEHATRYEQETSTRTRYPFKHPVGADGLYVFVGIGKFSKLLVEGKDYLFKDGQVVFAAPPCATIDVYSKNAWPERFTRTDLALRRRKTKTLNYWDSQYQLEAKAITESRLDPEKLIEYSVEPRFEWRNRVRVMLLGQVQIVGVVARWDCSLGKVRSDASAVAIIFTDAAGRYYWHRSFALTGELEEFDQDRRTLIGGQIKQLLDELVRHQVPHVTIETNGVGGFVPGIARKWLSQAGIGVTGEPATGNKVKDILDSFEGPMKSRNLWAHSSVLDGPAWDQMRDFNPLKSDQPDDYIDAAARAIKDTPVRVGKQVGKLVGKQTVNRADHWAPAAGSFEVTVDPG